MATTKLKPPSSTTDAQQHNRSPTADGQAPNAMRVTAKQCVEYLADQSGRIVGADVNVWNDATSSYVAEIRAGDDGGFAWTDQLGVVRGQQLPALVDQALARGKEMILGGAFT